MDLNGQIANLDRIFTEIIDHRHADRNHMELFFPGGPPIGLNHQHFGGAQAQRFSQPEERKFQFSGGRQVNRDDVRLAENGRADQLNSLQTYVLQQAEATGAVQTVQNAAQNNFNMFPVQN
jgi:hypothetical protein